MRQAQAHTHTLQVCSIEHIMLVVSPTAGHGLAGGTGALSAGASVGLWIHDGEVRVGGSFGCTARGARREALHQRVLGEA